MTDLCAVLRSGDEVLIRGRRWRVGWISRYAECLSVRVVPDDPRVAPATFLYPFDDVMPTRRSGRVRRISRRKAVAMLRRALHEVTPFPALIATSGCAIRLLPYQLEPALSLLTGAATRVLIADDVGLGKTIQAGIAITELAARNEANHTLIVVPAGLIDQWHEEMESRFGLAAEHVDANWLRLMGRSLPPWVSPWRLPGILLISIDLLKRREVIAQLQHVAWDLVVVDEAHRATGSTDRHRAVAHVCSRSCRALLLTATPHAGESGAFTQIQQLGAIAGDALRTLTFARTRSAVAPLSLRRRARYLRVALTRDERLMHAALDRYVRRLLHARRPVERDAVRLAMIVLKKRALSSAFSLRRSLARRLASIEERMDAPAQLGLEFDRDPTGELVPDDREPNAILATVAAGDIPHERELLARLIAVASAAERRESKLGLLERVLARTSEPVIVFTEYRDTLEHVAAEIQSSAPSVILHGGLAPDERRAAVSAFTRGTARVLLATDAAAEGLNLHERCRWVINLELPWAPLRLIQRAGRVDRIGQQRRVHAWHLIARDTDEARLLLSLSIRAERAASALARERSLGEQAVASALVDGTDPFEAYAPVPVSVARTGTQVADREIRRLEQLRAFAASARTTCPHRPGIARVRRRRGFSAYRARDLVLVFAGRAFDRHGSAVATRLGAARSGCALPSSDLDSRLVADGERHQRAAAVAARRRGAIARAIDRSRTMVQPALFDHRALDARDDTERQIAAAQRQLATGRPAAPSLLYDLVVGFEVT